MSRSENISTTPIAIVGNINLDIKTSVLPATPALFDDGETSAAEIYESLGGGGANTAVAAAQLGGRVHFCGCVGADALGQRLEQALEKFGIVAHLSRKPVATGRSLALTWDNHHRHFISSLANNRALSAADVDVAELARAGCRALYRADVWFSEAMLAGGNAALLQQARALGLETSLDINWDPEWSGSGCGGVARPCRPGAEGTRSSSLNAAISDMRANQEELLVHSAQAEPPAERVRVRKAQIAAVLPDVTWVHGNARELALFTGKESVQEACLLLIGHGCGGVVVHRGAKGAAAFTAKTGWLEIPATPVEKIVCETGPGDAFTAAFMLLHELPLRERLQACARIAAAHLQGAPNLLPRLTAVQ